MYSIQFSNFKVVVVVEAAPRCGQAKKVEAQQSFASGTSLCAVPRIIETCFGNNFCEGFRPVDICKVVPGPSTDLL
jgi:hypothetical protein